MVRTILFDLDGTLLHLDMDEFLGGYLKLLSGRFAEYMDPRLFAQQLMASTELMVRNEDLKLTNEEVFARDFYPKIGIDPKVARPVIDDFYLGDFNLLEGLTRREPAAHSVLTRAAELGYRVVVATNPVFPRIAVDARLRWANVHDFDWAFVTSYEVMHSCKPNRRFFTEVLERIGAQPEECLMVGNDVDEDLAAGALGIKTFLTEACRINRRGRQPVADHTGSLSDLERLLVAGDL